MLSNQVTTDLHHMAQRKPRRQAGAWAACGHAARVPVSPLRLSEQVGQGVVSAAHTRRSAPELSFSLTPTREDGQPFSTRQRGRSRRLLCQLGAAMASRSTEGARQACSGGLGCVAASWLQGRGSGPQSAEQVLPPGPGRPQPVLSWRWACWGKQAWDTGPACFQAAKRGAALSPTGPKALDPADQVPKPLKPRVEPPRPVSEAPSTSKPQARLPWNV